MMKKEMKTKIIGIIVFGVSFWYLNTINKKYNNISKKIDMVISNQEMIWLKTNELKIDSLQEEMMDIGWKLDSMILEHDYNYSFTN